MTSKEEGYTIKDWTPPWLDNGAALLHVVKLAQQLENPLSWQIVCSLLQRQMEVDLKIAREVNFMFNPDMNEDALPYMWESDIRMKNLSSFWDSITEFDPTEDDEDDSDF